MTYTPPWRPQPNLTRRDVKKNSLQFHYKAVLEHLLGVYANPDSIKNYHHLQE